MKVFVAGATGYVGRAVVEECVAHGADTVAHVRGDSPRLDEWKRHFAALGASVDTTPWQSESMTKTLEQLAPDVVCSLLGTSRHRARIDGQVKERFRVVDWQLTTMLLNTAAQASSKPLFVYLSSVGASQKSKSEYLRIRADVERAIIETGLDYVVLRASFITGKDRDDGRVGERLSAGLFNGALGLAGLLGAKKSRKKYRSADNHEMASYLYRAIQEPSWRNRILNMADIRE